MSDELACYRCGASLLELSPPLSRQDECPSCSVYLHVCRMCIYFDARIAKQCRIDETEEVFAKERPNFCDWFKPSVVSVDEKRVADAARAGAGLAALFGDSEEPEAGRDPLLDDANDLFGQ